ncbi:MAG: NCS2 family permease [Sedimentisphaerales bacterium]|jgi:AGZA family xanthine/uracil permease-like MFS transporter
MAGDYFELKAKGTSVKTETIAGITTFLTMAYIIFVNPTMLSKTGMDKNALVAVVCLVSAISTIITGVFGKAPIAMAPGMGLNAFFTYTLVLGKGLSWETALGAVFVSGALFLLLTLIGLRKKLVEAIPPGVIAAISVGIGLFITFIGLVNLNIIVKNDSTLVSAGPLGATTLIGLAGLLFMLFFEMKGIKGSLLIGIAVSTLLAIAFGYVDRPMRWVSFDVDIRPIAFHLDIFGALKWGVLGSVFSLMFMDMFDSIGTLVACCHQAKMVDSHGKIKGMDRLLAIDAIATMTGAIFGTSTTTAYIESAAGIEQGGRTGLTSVVTGALFLLAIIFAPLVGIVPEYATAPALIMVGLFMMKEVRAINFADIEEAFPAFIIIVMIALSYSISTGLAFGFISFVLIKSAAGKAREIKPTMWIIAIMSLAFLAGDKLGDLMKCIK